MIRGIAFSGKAGSGKTTIAQAVDNRLLTDWMPSRIMRLADGIYAEAYTQGMSTDPSKKDRPLLQRIGDERTRQDPTYYARSLVERAETVDDIHRQGKPNVHKLVEPRPVIVIVDDLRKVIEAEYLRQKGFVLVRLDVSPAVQRERLLARDGRIQEEALNHWTETDLDHYDRWDVKLPNNGTMTPDEMSFIIVWTLGLDLREAHGQ